MAIDSHCTREGIDMARTEESGLEQRLKALYGSTLSDDLASIPRFRSTASEEASGRAQMEARMRRAAAIRAASERAAYERERRR